MLKKVNKMIKNITTVAMLVFLCSCVSSPNIRQNESRYHFQVRFYNDMAHDAHNHGNHYLAKTYKRYANKAAYAYLDIDEDDEREYHDD